MKRNESAQLIQKDLHRRYVDGLLVNDWAQCQISVATEQLATAISESLLNLT